MLYKAKGQPGTNVDKNYKACSLNTSIVAPYTTVNLNRQENASIKCDVQAKMSGTRLIILGKYIIT